MELAAQAEVESTLRNSNIHELRDQHASIERELSSLNEQIGDLAFNNYRTYADAGRTTQHCTKIFTEMNTKLREVSDQVPALTDDIKQFFDKAKKLNEEAELVKTATDRTHAMWDILGLPAKMDMYIRTGYYDSAYALTNYGMTLQQHDIVKNPLIKLISDRMVEARSVLLEELFNKFAGPLDLATSIQVVNNVRKIPFLTGTQLRVSVLQRRDVYLDKQILDISSHPDFILKAIDIYKECMYETVVLYTAVFPENEITKKDPSVDPRWEAWPACTPSVILSEWAGRNVRRLLDIIDRAEMKAAVDLSSIWSQLMSFGSSFGRMGLDYRPIILQHLQRLVLDRFRAGVRTATARLQSVRTLNVLVAAFSSTSTSSATTNTPSDGASWQVPQPTAELSAWDDICVYGNGLLEAINGLKYAASPVLLSSVLSTLRESLTAAMSWLAMTFGGAEGTPASPHFPRAARLIGIDLIRFLNACVQYYFPYDSVARLFGSDVSKQQYLSYTDLNARELIATCDGTEKMEEVLLPLLNRPKLSALDIDSVMTRKPAEDTVASTDTVVPISGVTDGEEPATATTTPRTVIQEADSVDVAPNIEVTVASGAPDPVIVPDPVVEPEPTQPRVKFGLPEPSPETEPEPEPESARPGAVPEVVTVPTSADTVVDDSEDVHIEDKKEEEEWGWGEGADTAVDTVTPSATVVQEEQKEWGWGESSASEQSTVAPPLKKKDGKDD